MRLKIAAVVVLLALLGATGCQVSADRAPASSSGSAAKQSAAAQGAELPEGAWSVAKAAATKIAMGQSPGGDVAATRDYYDRLQHPSDPAYVRAWTPREDNFIRNDDGSLQVNFIVQNLRDESIPMVAYSVMLRPEANGWKIDGFGHAP